MSFKRAQTSRINLPPTIESMSNRSFATCSILATMALSALPGSAATFTVTQNVWGTDSTAGTFAWAMHQADTTPGFDTISLTSNVSIDDYLEAHHPFRLADITDLAGLRI